MAAEKLFYVWITTDNAADEAEKVVGRLVRRAWRVGALGNYLSLKSDDNPAVLIALSMAKTPKDDKELAVSHVIDEVKDVLKILKLKHYSIVVVESAHCTWSLGNISLAELKKQEEEARRGMN